MARHSLSPERRALLDRLLQEEGIERAPARTIVSRPDPRSPTPLTFSQRRLWFLDRLAAHTATYTISAALRIRGDFRSDVFRAACGEVIRRHEPLRTVFVEVDGEPMQRVLDESLIDFRVIDLVEEKLGHDAIVAEVIEREAALIETPFDLTRGPLLRVEVMEVGPGDAVILVTMHHIVSDRWSMGVLLKDMIHFYGELAFEGSNTLPPLPVQYADFAAWQNESGQALLWEDDLRYWLEQLGDVPPELGLVADRPRPREKTYHGSSVPIELSPDLVRGLRSLAAAEGATPFMVLTTVFAVVLARLGGTDDVVIGTPVANRTLVELEPLVGLFVNTLALRTDVSGDPPVRDLVQRVRRVCLDAYDHQNIPFEKLVEDLQPHRSLARTPIFQVLLSYQNVPFPSWNTGSSRIEPIGLPARKAEFDLLLDLFEDGPTVWGRLEYSADIFEPDTANRLVSMFEAVLGAVVADPDRRVSDLALVDGRRLPEIAAAGSGGPVDIEEAPVHDLVMQWARSTPDSIAIDGVGSKVTYEMLGSRVERMVRRLRILGVGAGSLVAVGADDAVSSVVAMLSVLGVGAGYVPISADLSGERLRSVLDDWSIKVLLCASPPQAAAVGHEGDGHTAVIQEWDDDTSTEFGADPVQQKASPSPAATGATDALSRVEIVSVGRDGVRGIANTHAGMSASLGSLCHVHRLEPSDRVMAGGRPAGDAPAWELLWPLASGATLILAEMSPQPGPDDVVEILADLDVTVAHLSAGSVAALARTDGPDRCPDLRSVVCTDSGLTDENRARFLTSTSAALHELITVVGVGGPVSACEYRLDPSGDLIAIGGPTPGFRRYVFDAEHHPLPDGVTGELMVGGVGVGVEFAGAGDPQPVLMNPIPDPFAPEATLVGSGILARISGDGRVDLLGRLDRRVLLAGGMVDLDRAECELATHPDVTEAAVVTRPDTAGELRLVAYVSGSRLPPSAELRAHLHQRLPDYSVPDVFVGQPVLPRFRGSVDHEALPRFELGVKGSRPPHVEPRNRLEAAVAETWRELLGADRVGVEDRFFDLGGQSLLATRLVSRIQAEHGVAIALREVFDNPSVAELADRIETHRSIAGDESGALPVANRADPIPLTHAQRRLCESRETDPEDPVHNVVTAVLLEGVLDREALERSLDQLVDRHELLRSRFVKRESQWTARILPSGGWPLTHVDLASIGHAEQAAAVDRIVRRSTGRPVRIGMDPPVSGTLVSLDGERQVLVLSIHHLVTDNWSFGVLIRDLYLLYSAYCSGGSPDLVPLAVNAADHAVWQHGRYLDGGLDEHSAYWRKLLRPSPDPLTLRAPESQRGKPASGHSSGFTLDANTTAALADLARSRNSTLFIVLLAAFNVLVSSYADSEDIAVAFPEAGRHRAEFEDIVGYLVTTLAVRADLSAGQSFEQLLAQVRDHVLEATAHGGVSPWVANEGSDPARVLCNLLNAPMPPLELPGLRVSAWGDQDYAFSEVATDVAPTDVDLALVMREDQGGLRGTWLYALDAVDAEAVGAMMDRWPSLLRMVAAKPGLDVGVLRRLVLEASSEIDETGDPEAGEL